MGGRGSSSSRAGGARNSGTNQSARYDQWQNARQYAREMKPLSEPSLTATQRRLYYDAVGGDYSSLEKASTKTLTAIKSKSEYEYDKAQRLIAKGDYVSSSDFVQDGKFDAAISIRKTNAKITNIVINTLENKGSRVGEREITSSTYKSATKRRNKQIYKLVGGK